MSTSIFKFSLNLQIVNSFLISRFISRKFQNSLKQRWALDAIYGETEDAAEYRKFVKPRILDEKTKEKTEL